MFQILFIKLCRIKHVLTKYGLVGSSLLPMQCVFAKKKRYSYMYRLKSLTKYGLVGKS